MPVFPSEPELIAALDRSDELVRLCASGQLSFSDFCGSYDNFFWSYALDGHEAGPAGEAVLAKYFQRIAPHRTVAETSSPRSALTLTQRLRPIAVRVALVPRRPSQSLS